MEQARMNVTSCGAVEPPLPGASPDPKFTTLSRISEDQIELLEFLRRTTGDLERLTLHMGRPTEPTRVETDSECSAPFETQKEVLRECFRQQRLTDDLIGFLSEVLS